jgi:hypothetical protein
MEVSILYARPGTSHGVRSFLIRWLTLLLLAVSTFAVQTAHGFSLIRLGPQATANLDPDDIFQGGATLGGSSEQTFGQGTLPVELTDFGEPLDVNISASFGGSATLTTRLTSNFAFAISLSRSERNECLNDGDFDVRLQFIGTGTGIASDGGAGQLEVLSFTPQYRGSSGRRCPSVMFYGFSLDLGLEGAISAGSYTSDTEITVERIGPGGGAAQTTQLALRVVMPGFLLLYHPDRINIDLRASAVAGLLGATASCGLDGCLDLGARDLTLTSAGQALNVGVDGAAEPVSTVQTITLRNAVGARATGCPGDTYSTASYQIISATGGIGLSNGPVTGIANQPCGLDLRTGDLSFELDLAQATGTTGSATIQITVTGI